MSHHHRRESRTTGAESRHHDHRRHSSSHHRREHIEEGHHSSPNPDHRRRSSVTREQSRSRHRSIVEPERHDRRRSEAATEHHERRRSEATTEHHERRRSEATTQHHDRRRSEAATEHYERRRSEAAAHEHEHHDRRRSEATTQQSERRRSEAPHEHHDRRRSEAAPNEERLGRRSSTKDGRHRDRTHSSSGRERRSRHQSRTRQKSENEDRKKDKQPKYVLMQPTVVPPAQHVQQHEQPPHIVKYTLPEGVEQSKNKERIEIIVKQAPPQQIQFPHQLMQAQPQPIVINAGPTSGKGKGHEYNPILSESTIVGPATKRRRHAEHEHEYKPFLISEGTGASMIPIYGDHDNQQQLHQQLAETRAGAGVEADEAQFHDRGPQHIVVDIEPDQTHPAPTEQKKGSYEKRKSVLFASNVKEGEVEEEEEDEGPGLEQEVFRPDENTLEVKRQYGEHCPLCGVGILKEEFTWTGWLFALLCFPCGVFLLFSSKAVTCSYCRQVFHL